MDHIRVQNAELLFGPFVYDHQIILPDRQRDMMRDVGLRMYGLPTQANASTRTAPDDVRLYIDDVDITEAYKAELKILLNNQDQSRLSSQYKHAMDKWISLAEALGGAYGHDTSKDKAARDSFLATQPFSALVDQLGNIAAGNAGFMHVFNYLHVSIDLPPVSLRGVALRINKDAGHELIKLHGAGHLLLSNGPSRFHTGDWRPKSIFGSLRVQTEIIYHDPLEDKVAALEQRLSELEQTVADGLAEVLDAVGPDGSIARALRRADASIADARASVAALKNEVASQANQIAGLHSTARDLKTAVDAL